MAWYETRWGITAKPVGKDLPEEEKWRYFFRRLFLTFNIF